MCYAIIIRANCRMCPGSAGVLTECSQMLQDALLEPVGRAQGVPTGYETNMATARGYLQRDSAAKIGLIRKCRFRKKRIISRLQHKGRYGDALQKLFAAGLLVIVINSAESMQRGCDGVIELPERA